MASKVSAALDLIASQVAAVDSVDWDTTPAMKWYPDFTREVIESQGLTAHIVPAIGESDPISRKTTPRKKLAVEVAVMRPMQSLTLAEGDSVVKAAEAIVELLHKKTIVQGSTRLDCTDARIDPIVAADFAKQHAIWCSIVKLEIET